MKRYMSSNLIKFLAVLLALSSSEAGYCGFQDLPKEVQAIILNLLPQKNRVQTRRLSKSIKNIISSNTLEIDLSSRATRETLTDSEIISALEIIHRTYPKIQSLNLSGHGTLTAKTVEKVAELFSDRLEFLDMSDNRLDDTGAEKIAALTRLRYLDIGHNQVTDVGITSIVTLSELQHLGFSENSLGIEGAEKIATLPYLKSLDISYNYLREIGIEQIAKMNYLESLTVTGNYLTDFEAAKIAQMRSLQALDISSNLLTHSRIGEFKSLKNLKSFKCTDTLLRQ